MINREQRIFTRVKEHYEILQKRGYNVVAIFLQGSQNYELDVYTSEYMSDIDTKAIVVPTFGDVVNAKTPVSHVIELENKEHIEVKDIRVMVDMWRKQNLSYLELLFTKFKIVNPKYKSFILELISIRDDIVNINRNQLLRCMAGMSMEKFKALEHPYPSIVEKIEKYGYDPKQLHHIMRLNDFMTRYLDNLPFEECFVPSNKEYLIDIKLGALDLEQARALAREYDGKNNRLMKANISDAECINNDTLDIMNDIKCRIIEHSLKNELQTENNPIPKLKSGRVFVTADLHFYHEAIIKLDNRPFSSVEDMNNKMIAKWNEVVSDNDEIYILGDLSFGSARQTNELLKSLNGIKYLIIGNHDEFLKSKKFDKSLFEWIKESYTLEHNSIKYVMCHYPMMINDIPRNMIMLHGHLHNRAKTNLDKTYNVGVMMNDFYPMNIDSFVKKVGGKYR